MAQDPTNQEFAQELYDTYSCAGLSITACGVNQNHPQSTTIQAYADKLASDISGMGASIGSIASKALPAGAVAAAISAVASIEPGTAGVMAFAAGAAGAVSAFTGPRVGRSDDTPSR